MEVTERGFAAMCSAAARPGRGAAAAASWCCVLEGGYSLSGLSQSVHACLEVLTGRTDAFPEGTSRAAAAALAQSRAALRPYWPALGAG